MIEGGTIDAAVQPLLQDTDVVMSTIAEPLERPGDALDPSVVKVVIDSAGNALYFSRAPIPFPRDETDVVMSTIAEPLERPGDALDPSVVKVVIDSAGNALYFSRAPIPFPRDET